MYKAVDDGPKYKQLWEIHRTSGFPQHLSVTTSPKATYRECDIISMLERHHPDPSPDKRIEIVISDDFSAHKTNNVRNVQWAKGFFGMILGGGTTAAMQPCDTALNQHCRRKYGFLAGELAHTENDWRR